MSNLALRPGTRVRVISQARLQYGKTLVVVCSSSHRDLWLCTDTGHESNFVSGDWFVRDELKIDSAAVPDGHIRLAAKYLVECASSMRNTRDTPERKSELDEFNRLQEAALAPFDGDADKAAKAVAEAYLALVEVTP